MNHKDAISDLIREGITKIYESYTAGKTGLNTTCTKLGDFLDSKGEEYSHLAALAIIKNWRR